MNLSTNYVSVTHVSAAILEKRLRKVKKDLGAVTVQHLGTTATTRQIINAIGQQHMSGLRGLFDGQRKHIKGKDEQGRPFILTYHGERDETYRYELIIEDAFDLKSPEDRAFDETRAKNLAELTQARMYGLRGKEERDLALQQRAQGINQTDPGYKHAEEISGPYVPGEDNVATVILDNPSDPERIYGTGSLDRLAHTSNEPADGPLYDLCKELGVPELAKEGQHPLQSFDRDRFFQFLQAAEERYPNQGGAPIALELYNRLAGLDPMYAVHAASEFIVLFRDNEDLDEVGTMTNVYALGLVDDFIEQLDIDPHLKSIATVTPVTAVIQVMKVLVESPADLGAHQKNWAPFVALHGQSSDFEAIVDYLKPAIDILSELRGQGPVVRKATADNAKRILAEFDAEFGKVKSEEERQLVREVVTDDLNRAPVLTVPIDTPVEEPMVKQHPIFTFNYDAALAELRQIHADAQEKPFEPITAWTEFFHRQGLNDWSLQVLQERFMVEYGRSEKRDARVTQTHLLRRALLSDYLTHLERDAFLVREFHLTLEPFSELQLCLLNYLNGTGSLTIPHPYAKQLLDYLHPVIDHINTHLDYEAALAASVIARPQSKETTMNPVTLTKAPRCDVIIPEVTELVLVNLEPFGLSEHKDLVETYYRAALQAPTQEQAKVEIDALCSEFMDLGYENIDPFRFESYTMLQAVGKVFGEKPVNHPDTTHEPVTVEDPAIQGRTDVLDFFDMRKALFMERHWSLSRNKPKTNPEKFQIPGAIREQFPTLDLSKDEQRVALMRHYAAEVYAGEGAFEAACNYAGTDDAGHKYHISNGIQDVRLVVIWGNRITDYTLARKQA